MTIQEIKNKIDELRSEGKQNDEIFIITKELYPNFPEIKLKALIGGIR
jgi:hypothetical protein